MRANTSSHLSSNNSRLEEESAMVGVVLVLFLEVSPDFQV